MSLGSFRQVLGQIGEGLDIPSLKCPENILTVWGLTRMSFSVYYASQSHLQSSLPHLWFYSSPSVIWNRLALICLNVTCEVRQGQEMSMLPLPSPGSEWKPGSSPVCWQMNYWARFTQTRSLGVPVQPGGDWKKGKNLPQRKQLDSLLMSSRLCLAWYASYTHTKAQENIWTLKGIVQPKMKILSLITHPHVVPNL